MFWETSMGRAREAQLSWSSLHFPNPMTPTGHHLQLDNLIKSWAFERFMTSHTFPCTIHASLRTLWNPYSASPDLTSPHLTSPHRASGHLVHCIELCHSQHLFPSHDITSLASACVLVFPIPLFPFPPTVAHSLVVPICSAC